MCVFKIQLKGFIHIRKCLVRRLTKTRDIDIQTLGYIIRAFLIHDHLVCDLLHDVSIPCLKKAENSRYQPKASVWM